MLFSMLNDFELSLLEAEYADKYSFCRRFRSGLPRWNIGHVRYPHVLQHWKHLPNRIRKHHSLVSLLFVSIVFPVWKISSISVALMHSSRVVIPIYVFYWKGPVIRERSKFAQTLAADREAVGGRRVSKADNLPYPEV